MERDVATGASLAGLSWSERVNARNSIETSSSYQMSEATQSRFRAAVYLASLREPRNEHLLLPAAWSNLNNAVAAPNTIQLECFEYVVCKRVKLVSALNDFKK